MARSEDHDYYRQRASKERALASASIDRSAAIIHLKMAEEYDRRLEQRHGDPSTLLVVRE
ncbi:hypothetical protein [Sphingomonas sp. G-3-2-10]|jgi:hypothetical protein|uniref:hypothetical protein n=1 Tax=Sphingomonas sp. G-3-2-10 TaxID=2728838 RepID=UPI001469DE67|nr:hypothetical protein [Sphingomonas sp. G-3-2-10]NML07991.1 hypothetical protein [Sphingomonas sp. G-3-2-10]